MDFTTVSDGEGGSLVFMGFPPSKDNSQRRSQRVLLKAPVVVLARGDDNQIVSEETRTVTVNAHGAMVHLRMKVSLGQSLTLRNLTTGEEASCRVGHVGPHLLEKKEVGVDFERPRPRFWRISFPPTDWSTHSPEAKDSRKKK